MAYLLTCCSQAVTLLLPLCNVLVALNLKKEQWDYFMSPKSMFVMHILADMEPVFKKGLLKVLDSDDGLIINAYRINTEFHASLEGGVLKFPKLTSFLDNIEDDDNGNISVASEVAGN